MVDVVQGKAVTEYLQPRALEEAVHVLFARRMLELRRVAQHSRVEDIDPEGGLAGDAHAPGIERFELGKRRGETSALLGTRKRRVVAANTTGVEVRTAQGMQHFREMPFGLLPLRLRPHRSLRHYNIRREAQGAAVRQLRLCNCWRGQRRLPARQPPLAAAGNARTATRGRRQG